jgi:hypothetical protein
MNITPEQLCELIIEAERECPIDFGYLSIDENSARLLIANQLIEMFSDIPGEYREISLLAALGHQVFQNEILNFNLINVVKNNSKVELLPCPHCGHNMQDQFDMIPEETIYPIDDNNYQIICQEYAGGCDCSILGESFEDCVKKWNRRHEGI